MHHETKGYIALTESQNILFYIIYFSRNQLDIA